MNVVLKTALAAAGLAIATQAAAQVTFFEGEDFKGRSFTTQKNIGNFERFGFNDRASSVVVARDRWEVCEDARFEGQCMVLRPGNYPSLRAMGLNDQISSVRNVSRNAQVEDGRYAPAPLVTYDARRRGTERLFEANVTSVRAVVGAPEKRCWVEREQVSQGRGDANVGGAIAGGLVGSNVGRDGGGQSIGRNVQRCETASNNARPEYWDVTYNFRGQEHRTQMNAPPGPTVTVNAQGEPRG